MFFTDSLHGWAGGFNGTLIATTDGGNNWEFQDINQISEVVDIFFLNDTAGWALSWSTIAPPYGTIILKTSDGGKNWEENFLDSTDNFMNAIYFLDTLHGFLGGAPTTILATYDGGLSWEYPKVRGPYATLPVRGFKFLNDDFGYAFGGAFDLAGLVWQTTDSGNQWVTMDTSDIGPDPLRGLHLFDSLKAIGISGDPEFYFGVGIWTTSDGGIDWDYRELTINGVPTALGFRTPNEAWAPMGYKREFIVTYDSGQTWSSVSTPDEAEIFDLVFTDSTHGFAVGENGVILKYKTDKPTYVNNSGNEFLFKTELFQNYPNPFNPSSRVVFRLAENTSVKLKLYDILGREIKTIFEGNLPAGSYTKEITANDLSAGVYFYSLETENYRQVKKLQVLK
ncbi:MAG: hypothetical protein Kow0098_16690 [Ignavibacteriaceae bacterium]